MEGFEFEGQ